LFTSATYLYICIRPIRPIRPVDRQPPQSCIAQDFEISICISRQCLPLMCDSKIPDSIPSSSVVPLDPSQVSSRHVSLFRILCVNFFSSLLLLFLFFFILCSSSLPPSLYILSLACRTHKQIVDRVAYTDWDFPASRYMHARGKQFQPAEFPKKPLLLGKPLDSVRSVYPLLVEYFIITCE
jgi:hypothetical protein